MSLEVAGGLSTVIKAVSQDKNLDRTIIVDALEQAVLHAARKDYGAESDLEATYNEESDEIELYQFRLVVEEEASEEEGEISLEEAVKLDPETELGDAIGIKLETGNFGRIAAQSAKQIIVQKVRDAERAKIFEEYKGRVGEILSGHVRRFERSNIIIDLGATEAVIPYKEQMQGERFRVKDRIQAYVVEIRRSSRGPQVVMSRAHPGFLVRLFEQHVTEIYDGIVTIESASRDPGLRSKIAVYSKDSSVDPVGACVGMKGARVQAVVQELNGEKIDIVSWDQDPAKLVCNALAPAVVSKVIVDSEKHSMEVIVAEDQLSLAIGKRGQNVRLAAQLTGWRLDIKSERKLEAQMAGVKIAIAMIDGLDAMQAGILVNSGVKSPEEVAALSPRALARLLNLDEDEAEAVKTSAAKLAADLADGSVTVELPEGIEEADSVAIPDDVADEATTDEVEDEDRKRRVDMFLALNGVGESAADAMADAGYNMIGDVIADSADEVAQRSGLPLSVARTVQIAADRYLQDELARKNKN